MTRDEAYTVIQEEIGFQRISEAEVRVQQRSNPLDAILKACERLAPYVRNTDTHEVWTTMIRTSEIYGPRIRLEACQQMVNAFSKSQVDDNKYLHKGLPFFLAFELCKKNQWMWHSRYFLLLALIEDGLRAIENGQATIDHSQSGAYTGAQLEFGITSNEISALCDKLYAIVAGINAKHWWTELIFDKISNIETVSKAMSISVSEDLGVPVCLSPVPIQMLFENRHVNSELCQAYKLKPGKALEAVVAVICRGLPGALVLRNMKGLFESDVFIDLSLNQHLSARLGSLILVECKDRKKKADVTDLGKFASSCALAGIACGIFVSVSGFTGARTGTDATKVANAIFYSRGVKIIVVDEPKLLQLLQNPGNLPVWLLRESNNLAVGIS